MLTNRHLPLLAAALLLALTAAGAQASPAAPAKPVAYGETCAAMPGYEGVVVAPAHAPKDAKVACKPGTGLTIYALPAAPASYIVAALCDVTKPVSVMPFEDGRVTAFCTYRGAEGVPEKVAGVRLQIVQP
jgi:hypothetical protein